MNLFRKAPAMSTSRLDEAYDDALAIAKANIGAFARTHGLSSSEIAECEKMATAKLDAWRANVSAQA